MIILMTQGTVTAPQETQNWVANRIDSPPGWVPTRYDRRIVPTYVLLSLCEDSVIRLFVVDKFVHIFVEDNTLKRIED